MKDKNDIFVENANYVASHFVNIYVKFAARVSKKTNVILVENLFYIIMTHHVKYSVTSQFTFFGTRNFP